MSAQPVNGRSSASRRRGWRSSGCRTDRRHEAPHRSPAAPLATDRAGVARVRPADHDRWRDRVVATGVRRPHGGRAARACPSQSELSRRCVRQSAAAGGLPRGRRVEPLHRPVLRPRGARTTRADPGVAGRGGGAEECAGGFGVARVLDRPRQRLHRGRRCAHAGRSDLLRIRVAVRDRPEAISSAADRAGRSACDRRGTDHARPLRPPRHAHDPAPRAARGDVLRAPWASARICSGGACPRRSCANWSGGRSNRSKACASSRRRRATTRAAA